MKVYFDKDAETLVVEAQNVIESTALRYWAIDNLPTEEEKREGKTINLTIRWVIQ